MPVLELEQWLDLQDRQLTFGCSDTVMDSAEMNANGFRIAGLVFQRVRRLRLRMMSGFHPASKVITNIIY